MAEASEVKSDDTTGYNTREGARDLKVAAMGDEYAKDPRQDQLEDDLEDGEIESDEDEPVVTFVQPPPAAVEPPKSKKFKTDPSPEKSTKSYPPVKSSRKFSRGGAMEDDWAENIENAIAAALKKDGIEPSRPEFKKHDDVPDEPPPSKNKSRKRKKRDQDKEKSKKKKHVHEEQTQIESDIDENEMLCIRGASPPLLLSSGRIGPIPPDDLPPAPSYYESDGSYTSYETEDSIEYRKPYEEKRQNRRNKDRRHRKGGGRGGGGTISDKRRNREESDGVCIDYLRGACANDDCPRNHDGRAQRKLELCKFYLMECCAKKEKCLYMHADFPCKYYYLGMECVYKGSCKFSHGKPLTDQLRNILLKHIETAPKEILGNFRRISRENAVALLNTAHAQICDDHGIENTLATTSTTSTMTTTTAAASSTSSTPSLSKQSNSASEPSSSIPSLLDMVIKPPAISPRKEDKEKLSKGEKTRKSRWCDSQQGSTSSSMSTPPSQQQQAAGSGGSGGGAGVPIPASFLNLKNLTGVITSDQIEKLESLGIENLEQVNQLTVAQLNNIGLTISQINEIQLNALNIQKLGLIGANSGTSAGPTQFSPSETKSLPAVNQDIDMRFLVAPPKIPSPGLYPASGGCTASSSTPAMSSSGDTDKMHSANVRFSDADIASPEPTPNYGGAKCFPSSDLRSDDLRPAEPTTNSSVVDYSQYLKDAHIDADKIDLNNIALDKDDETLIEDEPELLIDESWCPSEDEHVKDSKNDDGEDNWDDAEDKAKPATKAENGRSDWESSDQGKQEDPEEDWSVCAPVADYQQPSQDFCDENWDDDIDRPTAPAAKSDEYQEQSKRDNWDRRNYGKFRQNQNEEESWGSDYSKPLTKPTGTGGSGFYSQQQDTQSNWGGYGRMYQSGPSYFQQQHQQQHQQQLHQSYHPNQQQCQPYEQTAEDEENWDDDLDQQHQQPQTQPQKADPRGDSYLTSHAPMPAIYDPKSLMPSVVTSKIDISASVSSLMGMLPTPQSSTNQTYIDACGLIQDRVENEAKSSPQPEPREFRGDPRLYKSLQQQHHQHTSEDTFSVGIRSPPIQHRTSLDLPKYDRISIYDGTPKTPEDDQAAARKPDKDMRLSGFLDPNKSDIDLRLPFKRVMTNYIPATEIDGSISSHPPISYKVTEIEIPKPDYSEIRRSVPVTDKTLDPRLRRIFCLKESIDGDNESTASFLSSLSRQVDTEKSSLAAVSGGPRVDPRRKKENQDMFGGASGGTSSSAIQQQSASGVQQTPPPSKTLDIRMLLQKSDWYKNLNSKVKIMVNQQLALVSTELKKFHQDPSPNKVFDIQFIVSNQHLQQILTNLGIYIDDYGEVRQLENETDDGVVGGGGAPPMSGMMGMRMGMMDGGLGGGAGGMPMAQGPPPMMPMDFLRGPPPMNAAAAAAMQQRFMGGMMPFGGPPKPGLLGIAPGVGYNPFDPPNPNCGGGSSGDGGFPPPGQGGYDGGDGNMFGGGGGNNFPGASGGGFYRSGNRGKNDGGGGGSGGGGNRGNRNFRGGSGGNNSRNNDRWGGNSGPRNESGGGGNRRNYDNSRGGGRGGGRDRSDSRRDKM